MEELIDFLIDIFENVWRKFKINMALILTGGIISALLIMPYMFKYFPAFSIKYTLARVSIVILSFIFVKVCMLSIKEIKVNLNTWKILFQNLKHPLIFTIIVTIVFGVLAFISCVPFLFPNFTEKNMVAVCAAAIVAGISIFVLLPNIIISLLFSYEGKSFTEALSAGNAILEGRRGKMYFLTIALLLAALVLNLTVMGVIIVFPLIIMAMDQSRESLIKVDEDKRKEAESKANKSYRNKVEYVNKFQKAKIQETKVPETAQDNIEKKKVEDIVPEKDIHVQEVKIEEPAPAAAEQQPEEMPKEENKPVKTGIGTLFKTSAEEIKPVAREEVRSDESVEQKSEEMPKEAIKPVKMGIGTLFKAGAEGIKPAEELKSQEKPAAPEQRKHIMREIEEKIEDVQVQHVPEQEKSNEAKTVKTSGDALQADNNEVIDVVLEKDEKKKNPKILSSSEYEKPATLQEQEDQLNLNDFIDLGVLYERKESDENADKDDALEIKSGKETEFDIDIEIELPEKKEEKKHENKSGKAYLEDFGTIKRKPPEADKDKREPKKDTKEKNYLEDFGTIIKKKE